MHNRPHILTLAIVLALALCCFAGCSASQSTSSESGASAESSADESFASVDDVGAVEGIESLSTSTEIIHTILNMTLEQKVAQLFIVTPETLNDLDDGSGNPMLSYPVGGLLYFGYHLESPNQTQSMLADAQQKSQDAIGLPIFLCIDEEGGTVSRIGANPAFGVSDVGNMADIGASGNVDAAHDAATYVASYLRDLGFNVNFAPDADLANGDDSLALRSFGVDADQTSRMVAAQVDGFLQEGMMCAVKHFPGIGGIEEDSHEDRIYSHLSMAEFKAGPLKPFAAGIEAGVPFVMVGHLSTPEATGNDVPASLSRSWIVDTLRGELGYKGIVVVDSLGMGAVYDRYSQYELGALCLEGGADMLLKPEDFPTMYQGVLDAIERGDLSEARINEALARVLIAKSQLK